MTGDLTGGHGDEAGDDSWATRMPVGTVIKASRLTSTDRRLSLLTAI
jgi:hypothetical protein